MATVARPLFRLVLDDDEPLDFFDEELRSLDLLPDRPLLADLRDELPRADEELFDLLPDEDNFDPPPEDDFDRPLDDELLPLLLFEPPELLAELDLPWPGDDFDELLDFRPDEEDIDDLDRPEELDEPTPEPDFDRPPPFRDREDELFPLDDRPPLRDADERPPPDEVIVSAAAPIAPIAAPEAAPLRISPATSTTLSTIAVVELFGLDDLRRDEDELLFREPLELDLLAINFPPNDRNNKLNCL